MNTRPRSLINVWLLAILFLLIFNLGLAADDAPAAPQALPDQIVAWLTPILVPLVLAGVKKVGPKLPSWIIPLLAPVLGLLIGFINNLVTSNSGNLWLAAGLGLLGIAVREVKEAVAPAKNGGWPADPAQLSKPGQS